MSIRDASTPSELRFQRGYRSSRLEAVLRAAAFEQQRKPAATTAPVLPTPTGGIGANGEEEHTSTKSKQVKTDDVDVPTNVLMGLSEDMWLLILQSIDDKDVCGEIGKICKVLGNTADPLKIVCGNNATFDMLNRSLGFYGRAGNIESVIAWCNQPENAMNNVFTEIMQAVPLNARSYFEIICMERKAFVQAGRKYRATRSKEDENAYRLVVKSMTNPIGLPSNYAQAKFMVGLDPTYTFEFIPGSWTTLARYSHSDLELPPDDPLLQMGPIYVVAGGSFNNPQATHADITLPGYAEIAKIAINGEDDNIQYVRGSIVRTNGHQPFLPIEGYGELAKLSTKNMGANLEFVPGSTLNPKLYSHEVNFFAAATNYTEIAIAAANWYGILGVVPGSINPHTGNQFRKPIEDYYEIAEAHVRSHAFNLTFVPGSVPTMVPPEFRAPRIDNYAVLAKIAIEGNPAIFSVIPKDLPEYTDLLAYRDISREQKREARRKRLELQEAKRGK